MVILHKDGKVYRLESPNPLVKTQESWSDKNLIFHNFNWEEIKLKNGIPSSVKKVKTDMTTTKLENFGDSYVSTIDHPVSEELPKEIKYPISEEIYETKESEEVQNNKTIVEIESQSIESQDNEEVEYQLPYIKYKVLAHCLPAKIEIKSDNFYGETWQRVKYGKKIVIPFIMISSNDFAIEFWTSDPKNQIEEKSIIYPFCYEVHNAETDKYDRVPFDEYRWWKVTTKEPKEKGWLFQATPSDFQPDFSD